MGCDCKQTNLPFFIIIILLIVFLYYLTRKERLESIYTSGADMRELGQVFSSTDQGDSDPPVPRAELRALQGY